MYNIIQIQDRLKDVSDQYLQGLATRPTDDVPPFLVLSELKRRSDSKKAQEVRQAQDMSTVLEDQVAMQGMPVDEASAMARAMNPNTDTGMNTGRDEGLMAMKRASSIPSEIMSVEDEDVRGMSEGGIVEGDPIERGFDNNFDMPRNVFQPYIGRMQSMQARLRPSALQGLGMDIRRQVAGRTDGEVNEFITDVENMAEERFDVNLGQSTMPTPFSGKGGGTRMPRPMNETQPLRPGVSYTGVRPGVRPGFASAFGSVLRGMNDGGQVVGMSGGGLLARVSPRPDDTGKFEGLMGRFLGPSMGSTDLAAKWDAQFGMYYNPDGTIKDQYRDLVGGTATQATTDADDQLPSVKDAQRMMDINEIPSVPKETDDADDDDDDGTGSPTGFLADIKRSLAEMKEEAKDQRRRDEGLAAIQAGLAIYERGDLSKASEGIKTLQAQTKAAKDRELTAASVGAKIGIAEATIDQRAAAAKLAAQKALTKTNLTDAQALANYRMATETIDKLNKTLNDLTNPLSEEDKIKALERKAYFENVVDILGARVKGILGADIIDVTPKAGTS